MKNTQDVHTDVFQTPFVDREVEALVEGLLSQELSPESAVQVALLNNRRLQATYEDLTVAQADLVEAGLLRNPIFDLEVRFAEGGGGTGPGGNAVTGGTDSLTGNLSTTS